MKNKFSSEKMQLFLYFILISLVGSILLVLPVSYKEGVSCSYLDAMFTAVSAVCVTGLSTIPIENFSRTGMIFLLLLIETGGLGILTYISLLLTVSTKKISVANRNLIRDFFIDEIDYRPRFILRRIISFTLIIQLCGFLLLLPGLYSADDPEFIFHALFLSVSAFCNAGFSPYSDSLILFADNWYVLSVIMILIISGGIGFVVYSNVGQKIQAAVKGRKVYLTLHVKIVLISTIVLLVSGFLFTFISFYNTQLENISLSKRILLALFESVTLRTAGFETVSQKAFAPSASLYHLLLMFIGGSPGSIAGGVKTTTVFVTLLYLLDGNEQRNTVSFCKRRIPSTVINKSVTIVSRSIIMLMISAILLTAAENESINSGICSVLDILFETMSAFATVGLTRGITPLLSVPGKIIVILTMYIGRTGIFAMSIKSGILESGSNDYLYPEESVLIG